MVALAQTDPVPVLTARLGDNVARARTQVANLILTLRELDQVRDQLADQNIEIAVDLGGVGNAAMAARRDLERETGKPTFSFPKPR